MGKLNYLNVGCGNKFHKDWVNVDMVSHSEYVLAKNLLNGIPFPDNCFEVVYHSQVLEHIPKANALAFIKDCYRVLRPGGILRIVLPNLENIVDEYKKYLNENLEHPSPMSEANYDWIMLELYDQTVRNYTGGHMAEFIQQPEMVNEKYVLGRTGFVGTTIRNQYLNGSSGNGKTSQPLSLPVFVKKGIKYIFRKADQIFSTRKSRIGAFRLGGEVHMWMYDRYSLPRLLKQAGFETVSIKDPFSSDIPDWGSYELDVKEGFVYDPTSLFVEARK